MRILSGSSHSKIENGEQNLSLDMAYRISVCFRLLIPEVFPRLENQKLNTLPERKSTHEKKDAI